MAFNISALSPITTTAKALGNIILVTPNVSGYQPQNKFISNQTSPQSFQNPALLFNYEGEQSVSLDSDITDHFIEDNTAVQDQISLKPVTITTHGFIGELNDIAPIGVQIIQTLQEKLTTLSPYTPELSIVALNAYNQAFQAYQIAQSILQSGVSSWATITGSSQTVIGNNGLLSDPDSLQSKLTQTRQQIAFQQFFGYWQDRTLFTVQTPWAVFQNMAILHLRAIQEADTRVFSDFEVTFKQIRLASSITVSNQANRISQGRLQQQSGTLQGNGNTSANQSPSVNFSGGRPVP